MGRSKGMNWLGILPDGRHVRDLTVDEKMCLDVLQDHVGQDKAISGIDLAGTVFGFDNIERAKRNTRILTNHLLNSHKIPVSSMGGGKGGYWLTGDKEEENKVFTARLKRAKTGFIKASNGRKSSYIDNIEQLTLWVDEDEGVAAMKKFGLDPEPETPPAFVQLVTRYLDLIKKDPAKYADELNSLQERYGDIFVPRERLLQIKTASQQLTELLKDVA